MSFPLFPIGYGRQIIDTLRSLVKSHETRITALENGGGFHIVHAKCTSYNETTTLVSKDFDYASVVADFDAGISVNLDVDVTITGPDMEIIDHFIRRLQLVQINKKNENIVFGSAAGDMGSLVEGTNFVLTSAGTYSGYIDGALSS